MDTIRDTIREALTHVKVIDPHCHLRAAKPSADNLADIVLYHHVWSELVSSGMPQFEVTRAGLPHELTDPGMPSLERVRRALPYLKNIRNTQSGMFLRWLLRDLYDLPELSEDNLEQANDVVCARAGDLGWQEEVLRQRCGIETNITVEVEGKSYSPALRKGREMMPINIVDGKRTPQQVLAEMEAGHGREIKDAVDYREMLAAFIRGLPLGEYIFIALWTLPSLAHEGMDEEAFNRILRQVKAGHALTADEAGGFTYFATRCLLDELRGTDLRTIQWMVGAEVLLPHRSIPHWSAGFTGAAGRIANDYEDFAFNMTSASDIHTQDLAILAKHIPNISVAGYWWHTLYPFYIRKSLELRLDTVPANKIIAYFSDAYHSEWCYPKLKLVKQIVEDILVERVERGWYDLDLAADIVQQVFYEAPRRIYELAPGQRSYIPGGQ